MTGIAAPVELIVDSMSLCTALSTSNEQIDRSIRREVVDLRRLYEKKKINAVGWLKGTQNSADALTKRESVDTKDILKELMSQGIIPGVASEPYKTPGD